MSISAKLRFQNLLCATDFSEASMSALDTAAELCRRFGGELVLVNVVAPMPLMPAPSPMASGITSPWAEIKTYMDNLKEQHLAMLRKFIKERLPTEIVVRPVLGEGEAASEIVRIAEEKDVDMVVVGTHGHSGWRHLVFGSVAERVVRICLCPVLTVRSERAEDSE